MVANLSLLCNYCQELYHQQKGLKTKLFSTWPGLFSYCILKSIVFGHSEAGRSMGGKFSKTELTQINVVCGR